MKSKYKSNRNRIKIKPISNQIKIKIRIKIQIKSSQIQGRKQKSSRKAEIQKAEPGSRNPSRKHKPAEAESQPVCEACLSAWPAPSPRPCRDPGEPGRGGPRRRRNENKAMSSVINPDKFLTRNLSLATRTGMHSESS